MRLVFKIASCLDVSFGKGIESIYAIKPITLTNTEAEGDDYANGGYILISD
jgi:hypothetical protein